MRLRHLRYRFCFHLCTTLSLSVWTALHIFSPLSVTADCTGWYNFLPTTIYLWLISLTSSKELSILLLKLLECRQQLDIFFFLLFYKTDSISFQLIFQHDVDPVIRQAVELLVCPVSQVFFSPDIPDIPCNDTGDPLFPAVFCKISCNLVQIVRY